MVDAAMMNPIEKRENIKHHVTPEVIDLRSPHVCAILNMAPIHALQHLRERDYFSPWVPACPTGFSFSGEMFPL